MIIIMINLSSKNNNFTLNTRKIFLPIRQIQIDAFNSGTLKTNMADGAPTLAQSKAAALYGTVDL